VLPFPPLPLCHVCPHRCLLKEPTWEANVTLGQLIPPSPPQMLKKTPLLTNLRYRYIGRGRGSQIITPVDASIIGNSDIQLAHARGRYKSQPGTESAAHASEICPVRSSSTLLLGDAPTPLLPTNSRLAPSRSADLGVGAGGSSVPVVEQFVVAMGTDDSREGGEGINFLADIDVGAREGSDDGMRHGHLWRASALPS
jgi:hypothetical protein